MYDCANDHISQMHASSSEADIYQAEMSDLQHVCAAKVFCSLMRENLTENEAHRIVLSSASFNFILKFKKQTFFL